MGINKAIEEYILDSQICLEVEEQYVIEIFKAGALWQKKLDKVSGQVGFQTMKTIKDAVIELGGILPKPSASQVQGGYFIEGNKIYTKEVKLLCDFTEFESTAKRMGYINGYEWGKEYPTNGKRPALAYDVLVEFQHSGECWMTDKLSVECFNWGVSTAFRITDPRFKPVDEVSEIAESINKAECVSEISKSKAFEMKVSEAEQNNSWHERGELPPVGVECEFSLNEQDWYVCKVLCYGAVAIFIKSHKAWIDGLKEYCLQNSDVKFRPTKSHREKVIEAARVELKKMDLPPEAFAALYDLGMLVLPKKSGDTDSSKGKE